MQWSHYNYLFSFESKGQFLYNTFSNTLIELDEELYDNLAKIKDGENPTVILNETFLGLLHEKNILVTPEEMEGLLGARQYQRHAACFESSVLGLTICPTLHCNFRCPYCFESNHHDGTIISLATMDRLIDWVKNLNSMPKLSVSWYGGEPLLAFEQICDLTEKFLSLDITYEDSGLITNGYLLDIEKIAKLNELKITFIQITLDGLREVHDARRVLAGGGPTFDRIMKNISALMESDYEGKCEIRVNTDKSNIENYLNLQATLLKKFEGKRLSVYPGRVDGSLSHPYDHRCLLNNTEWTEFTLGLYFENDIHPPGGFYPHSNDSICVANRHYGFVVGPKGELYRCWDDVGKEDMVIGDIYQKDLITNPVLRAKYYSGIDPYNDSECRDCDVLPICGGGCAHKRIKSQHFGEKGFDFCSPYKEHLLDYLEAYIDTLINSEICSAILTPGKETSKSKGYRIISPHKNAL